MDFVISIVIESWIEKWSERGQWHGPNKALDYLIFGTIVLERRHVRILSLTPSHLFYISLEKKISNDLLHSCLLTFNINVNQIVKTSTITVKKHLY